MCFSYAFARTFSRYLLASAFTTPLGNLFSDVGHGHTCSANMCEHNCTDLTQGGFVCSCRPGYKPRATEKHTCEGEEHVHVYSAEV